MGRNKDKAKTSVWGKLFKYGIPPLITIGLCYVLFHDQDIPAMVRYIKENCNFMWILASMGLTFVSFIIRSARWRIQLRASDINPPLHIVSYSIVGTYAVNLVFPRAGEIWRSGYIASRQKAPFATVLGSMVAERLADTVTVLLLLLSTFFLAGDAVEGFIDKYPAAYDFISSALSSPWLYSGIAALVLGGVRFMHHKFASNAIEKVRKMMWQLCSGLMAIFHMRGAGKWLLLTLLLWAAYFASLLCCFMAFGFTRELFLSHGIIVVLVCYVLSSVAMGIPANGGIGPYQAALVFGLGFFIVNLNHSAALGFANTVLCAQIVTIILSGIPTFILIALDHKRRSRQSEAESENGE